MAKQYSNTYPSHWVVQYCGWACFALLYCLLAYSRGQPFPLSLSKLLLFMALGFPLTQLMARLLVKSGWIRGNTVNQVIGVFAMSVLFATLHSVVEIAIITRLDLWGPGERAMQPAKLFLNQTIQSFYIYLTSNLIHFIHHYIAKSRSQETDSKNQGVTMKELELDNISAHIDPHFIFNSLNGIRALIDEDPTRARKAVASVGNILRNSLQLKKQDEVKLGSELDLVRDYLDLQHIRYEDRLGVEYDIDSDTLDKQVPFMMLQNLVENAIKHGIDRHVQDGKVLIVSRLKEGRLELTVSNSGYLDSKLPRTGFGWSSTSKRLAHLFGDAGRFSIRETPDHMVEAHVSMPARVGLA
jgi:LytS/YehU family sensor histidine kinase